MDTKAQSRETIILLASFCVSPPPSTLLLSPPFLGAPDPKCLIHATGRKKNNFKGQRKAALTQGKRMLNGQMSWAQTILMLGSGQGTPHSWIKDQLPALCSSLHISQQEDRCGRRPPSRGLPLPGWAPGLPVQQSLVAEHSRDKVGCKPAGTMERPRSPVSPSHTPRPHPLSRFSFLLPNFLLLSFLLQRSPCPSLCFKLTHLSPAICQAPCALMGCGSRHPSPQCCQSHHGLGLKMVL